MPIPRIEALSVFAAKLMDSANLTLAERSEAERVAESIACTDSASAVGLPTEAVRACRKRIYDKLGVLRAGALISALQMLASDVLHSRKSSPHAGVRKVDRA